MNEIVNLFPNIRKFHFINETKIFNEIQNNKKILIFDLRSRSDFINYCLPYSINIPSDENPEEYFRDFAKNITPNLTDDEKIKEMVCKYKRFYISIIFCEEKLHRKNILNYSIDETNANDGLKKALFLYNSLVTNKVRELGLFSKGFDKLRNKYWFIVRKNLNEPDFSDIAIFPSEIVENKIFVGDQFNALNEKILEALKITHVINITKHIDNQYEQKGIKYIKIPIDDSDKNLISNYFEEVYYFIEEALMINSERSNEDRIKIYEGVDYNSSEIQKSLRIFYSLYNLPMEKEKNEIIKGEDIDKIEDLQIRNKICQLLIKNHYKCLNMQTRILIHCSLGMSRSPALAIMYLMKKVKLCYQSAMRIVNHQRDKCCPIQSFGNELTLFEKNNFNFCFNV